MNTPPVKSYVCNHCQKVFSSRNTMRFHKKKLQSKQFPATTVLFPEQMDLTVEVHCPNCDLLFASKRKLRAHHFLAHFQPNPLKSDQVNIRCNDCLTQFHTRSSYDLHRVQSHDKPTKSYVQCPHCASPKTMSNTQLRKHIFLEHKRSHQCSRCGQYSSSISELISHKKHNHIDVTKYLSVEDSRFLLQRIEHASKSPENSLINQPTIHGDVVMNNIIAMKLDLHADVTKSFLNDLIVDGSLALLQRRNPNIHCVMASFMGQVDRRYWSQKTRALRAFQKRLTSCRNH